MSDGDASVLVVLSDSAWDAYDKGIAEERGDEPRKGDLLVCKRLVLVSTPWGPIEERITFRVEELEYAGNIRITIGKPTSLLQRNPIVTLRERIENLALKDHPMDEAEEGSDDGNDEEIKEETSVVSAPSGQTDSGASIDVEMETVIDTTMNVLPGVVTAPSLNPYDAQTEEQGVTGASASLPTHTSPVVSGSSAQFQIDTQINVEATQAQAPPPQTRKPIRRNRGGYSNSMGREGFETSRGDNLTGPQAPTLRVDHRQGFAPAQPPEEVKPTGDKLLELMSKKPGQQPRHRSPEPSAPVSAQQEVAVEEVVVETPAKKKAIATTITSEDRAPKPAQPHAVVSGGTQGKRRRPSPTSLESKSAPRRIYRIPRDQQALLDDQSSWLPPAPGHEFPHPNVPVKLLKLWNQKAELDTGSPSQPSPIALIERSSGEKSVEELQLEAQADESESASDEPMSEDEIPWSQSPSRNQVLPPDSSAAPSSSAHTTRLGSRGGKIPSRDRAKSSTNDLSDTSNSGRGKPTQIGSQRQAPKPAIRASHTDGFSAQDKVASQPNSSSHQNADTPTGPSRSQATPAVIQTVRQESSHQSSPLPPTSGANASPVRPHDRRPLTTPVASQPIPTKPRNSAPLADNHLGPVKASTQQTPHRRYIPKEPKIGSSFTTPSGAPTGPRAMREPRRSLPNRGFHDGSKSTPDPKPLPFGGFYCPQPSGQKKDTSLSGPSKTTTPSQASRHDPAGTQASDMEMSVPRSLPQTAHRQNRRDYMRDAQRRHW